MRLKQCSASKIVVGVLRRDGTLPLPRAVGVLTVVVGHTVSILYWTIGVLTVVVVMGHCTLYRSSDRCSTCGTLYLHCIGPSEF